MAEYTSYESVETPEKKSKTGLIIVIVVAVILLCCCCIAAIAIGLSWEQIMDAISQTVPFVLAG